MELKDKCAIIVGGSSGIGEALARRLAGAGWTLALLARRRPALEAIAGEINQRHGEGRALVFEHDVTDFDSVPDALDAAASALGGLTLLVYSSGVMADVGIAEYDFAKDRQMVEVNLLGMMAWMNAAAPLFERLQGGVIVGIGSVAGDRGRKGQPGYNTSKGAQAIFLESLRNRLFSSGVRVITIKPGPVDTPLIRGAGNMPFMISAEHAARTIARAIPRESGTVYVPGRWALIMLIIRHIPSFIFRRMDIR